MLDFTYNFTGKKYGCSSFLKPIENLALWVAWMNVWMLAIWRVIFFVGRVSKKYIPSWESHFSLICLYNKCIKHKTYTKCKEQLGKDYSSTNIEPRRSHRIFQQHLEGEVGIFKFLNYFLRSTTQTATRVVVF